MIYVCCLEEMARHCVALTPSHLVSLVVPADQPKTPAGLEAERHLRLAIDDITEPLPGYVLPEAEHIAALVAFLRGWPGSEPLLVHCMAGVSRSMAAALTALALKAPGREAEVGRHLRQQAPHALPNRRMVALADRELGCAGRLIAAREAMGPAVPVFAGPLVRVPLLD